MILYSVAVISAGRVYICGKSAARVIQHNLHLPAHALCCTMQQKETNVSRKYLKHTDRRIAICIRARVLHGTHLQVLFFKEKYSH